MRCPSRALSFLSFFSSHWYTINFQILNFFFGLFLLYGSRIQPQVGYLKRNQSAFQVTGIGKPGIGMIWVLQVLTQLEDGALLLFGKFGLCLEELIITVYCKAWEPVLLDDFLGFTAASIWFHTFLGVYFDEDCGWRRCFYFSYGYPPIPVISSMTFLVYTRKFCISIKKPRTCPSVFLCYCELELLCL